MAASPRLYRRLPGRGTSWVEYYRLYEGPDHLLQVASSGFTETYRRFFFRDIQGFTLVQSNRRMALNLVLGGACVLFGLAWTAVIAAGTGFSPLALGVGGAGMALLGLPLLMNNLLGPTCVAWVHTAVQTERLRTVTRRRRAQRLLARIRPAVEAAQGKIEAGRLAQLVAEAATRRAPVASALGSPAPPVMAPARLRAGNYRGQLHAVLFSLLVADVLFTALGYLLGDPWATAIGSISFAALAVLTVMALIKQRLAPLPPAIKRIPWICVGLFAATLMISTGYGVYVALSAGARSATARSSVHDPFTLSLTVITTALSGTLGLIGLNRLREYRRTAPAEPAPGSPSADRQAAGPAPGGTSPL